MVFSIFANPKFVPACNKPSRHYCILLGQLGSPPFIFLNIVAAMSSDLTSWDFTIESLYQYFSEVTVL